MQIYFLRHGIAADRAPQGTDSARQLTPEGIANMEEEAIGLQRLDVTIDLLLTSPLVRARQTAEIIGHALGCEPVIEAALSPGMRIERVLPLLEQRHTHQVMIVGHEPDLSLAVSTLTGGGLLTFKKGGLALVELSDDQTMDGLLQWLLPPKALRAIGKR